MKIVFAILLLCLVFCSAEKVGKLVILDSTPELAFKKAGSEIAPEHVAGVLGQLLGVGGVHSVPSELSLPGNFFSNPTTNLLIVAEGVSQTNILSSIELASFDINSVEEESTRDLISRMFSGKALGSTEEPATIGDILCQVNEKTLIISVASNVDVLRSISLHGELLSENPQFNVISAYIQKNLGVSYTGKASDLKQNIQNLFTAKGLSSFNVLTSEGLPLFDENVAADKMFLIEMKVLSSFVSVLTTSDISALLSDNAPDFITIVSSSLKGIRAHYGEDSEQYTAALSKFNSVLKTIQSQFNTAFPQGLFEALLLQGSNEAASVVRERRSITKRDYLNIASPCFATLEACLNSTSSCSNVTGAACVSIRPDTNDCYRCKCPATFAGDSCEFVSLVAPFHLIFWTVIALIVALVLVVSSLAYMDPGKDTLIFKTASKSKTE